MENETTVTNLSLTAQAVLDAVDQVPRVLNCTQDHPLFAAAALRAAASHLSYLLPFEDSACVDVADLLAIADELEGAN
jgi:hypothetical protein